MSDLISRSALMSHIENQSRQWGEDYDAEQILGDIEDAPTAYDVDKVTEQIYKEQEREFINNEVAIGDMTCSKVIEIVKAGGVNE